MATLTGNELRKAAYAFAKMPSVYVRAAGTRGRNVQLSMYELENLVRFDTINQPVVFECDIYPAEIFINAINIDTNGRESTKEDQREA